MRVHSFAATTEGASRLGLRESLQRSAADNWIAILMKPEQAAESVLDGFKRALRQDLEVLGAGH